jgi:hypothetical protein
METMAREAMDAVLDGVMDAVSEYDVVTSVEVNLGFSRPAEVIDDHEGRGLKRAITRPLDDDFDRRFEYRRCRVRDCCAPGQPRPSLRSTGFETIDLGGSAPLQSLLAQIRQAGAITPAQASQLRRHLRGGVFPLSEGKCLKLLHIAPEGLIMRKGGPNGLKVDPDVTMSEMNGHDAALVVHGDQDVRGTPLKQIMRGFAPWVLRHETPDGGNRISPLVLVNLWIPLQQITRPLTLLDRRTLNAREHQLRYALPTDSFLDRTEDMRVNDIWALLHDDAQQWYFHSSMGHDQAYVFDTLGEPHGSCILPGEEIAEHYYRLLQRQCQQLSSGQAVERTDMPLPLLPASTTAPLRQAIATLAALAASAPLDQPARALADAWLVRAHTAMDSVVRKSLEMRVVALLLPNVWPFNRSRAA